MVGVGEVFDAVDLLLVGLEERTEREEAEVDDSASQAEPVELTRRLALADDRELHHVRTTVVRQHGREGAEEMVKEGAAPVVERPGITYLRSCQARDRGSRPTGSKCVIRLNSAKRLSISSNVSRCSRSLPNSSIVYEAITDP